MMKMPISKLAKIKHQLWNGIECDASFGMQELARQEMIENEKRGFDKMTEFNLSNHIKKYNRNASYIRCSKIKEFIKIIEDIIIRREPRRIQLLKLKKHAGKELLE